MKTTKQFTKLMAVMLSVIEMVPDLIRLRLVPGSTLITDLAGNVLSVRMDTAPIIQDGTIL